MHQRPEIQLLVFVLGKSHQVKSIKKALSCDFDFADFQRWRIFNLNTWQLSDKNKASAITMFEIADLVEKATLLWQVPSRDREAVAIAQDPANWRAIDNDDFNLLPMHSQPRLSIFYHYTVNAPLIPRPLR